jgi:predicted dehydrogenase
VKILFVGLGGIGQRHLRNLKAILGSDVEVHAYRVRGRCQALNDGLEVEPGVDLVTEYSVRVHDDLGSALAVRPSAVFVCNPSSLHMPVAMAAANAGCHLFVEKPLSHNLVGVDDLIRVTERQALVGMVGYQLRFHPCVQTVQRQLGAGLIGQPLYARSEVGEYLPNWHRYEDYRQMYASRSELGGGVILSQIHEMDYLYWFFGMPLRIFTLGGHLSSLEIDVEDVASSLIEFNVGGNTVPVHLHQDYVQTPGARACMLIGDQGKIQMNLVALTVDRYDRQGHLAERCSFETFRRNDLFVAELKHFLDCVSGRATPAISLRDGAQSLRMALAAKQSLETGAVVEPDKIHA